MAKETIKIKRAKLKSIIIYEIQDWELDILENGSKDSNFLEFGIFFLSTSLSFLIALLTCDFAINNSDDLSNKFMVFLCIVIFTFLLSAFCFFVWWRNKEDYKAMIKEIRKRHVKENLKSYSEMPIERK